MRMPFKPLYTGFSLQVLERHQRFCKWGWYDNGDLSKAFRANLVGVRLSYRAKEAKFLRRLRYSRHWLHVIPD